jgi:hypothetical protein
MISTLIVAPSTGFLEVHRTSLIFIAPLHFASNLRDDVDARSF